MNGVEKGRRGEDFAAAFLLERGYRVLERNWRRKTGEIDIIAAQGDMLVFCEVKSRKNFAFGAGAEAVDRRKQLRIIHTAMLYMQKQGYSDKPCRFDILEVYWADRDYPRMNQIINAFGL